MSQNSVQVADGKAAFPSNANDVPPPRENDLDPEAKSTLVARAKDVIAGRVPAPALVVPPEVERFMQREFAEESAGRKPPPTPEARRHIREQLSLQAVYAGQPVACFTNTDGSLAVLASREKEIWALLEVLTEDERAKVFVADTL
jgi:hypothetical protein